MQEFAKAHASVPGVAEFRANTLRELVPGIAAHGSFNFMSATGRRCGRTAPPSCTGWCASIPSAAARLADEDLSVDFSALTTPSDRVAVVVTEPLTADERWNPLAPGELAGSATAAVRSELLTTMPHDPSATPTLRFDTFLKY